MFCNLFDWQNSITALSNSILKYYGQKNHNNSLEVADKILSKPKRNIVFLLLDGMGENIINYHLPESSFLRKNRVSYLSSVFPPTTAAAATALESGLFPSQSGWLGWNVFWKELNDNVNLYPNTLSDGSVAGDVHLGRTHLAFETLTQQISKNSNISSCSFSEKESDPYDALDNLCNNIKNTCVQEGFHFIYGYINQPDGLLHRKGCKSFEIGNWLQESDKKLELLSKSCPETIFILTADHGFTDIEGLCLENYPNLMKTLLFPPSIEPRALNFFVKEGLQDKFLEEFHGAVGDSYHILSRSEVHSQNIFGPAPNHSRFDHMIGDYLAVALTPLTLFPNRSYLDFMVAAHGGGSVDEILVPLIIFEN